MDFLSSYVKKKSRLWGGDFGERNQGGRKRNEKWWPLGLKVMTLEEKGNRTGGTKCVN